MAKKPKAPKKEYDENGEWVMKKPLIKGAIRRVFRQSPQMKEVLDSARVELPPKIKKDGEPGKKNQVRYACAICSGLFPKKFVQVDHIEPVVPLWLNEASMSIDELANRIICRKDNLQVVCSTPKKYLEKGARLSCHSLKTNEENFIRGYLSQKPSEERIFLIEEGRKEYLRYVKDLEEEIKAKLLRKLEREEKKKLKLKSL